MITKVFCIRDSKMEIFGVPFFMAKVEGAIRAFNDLANDARSSINKHPEDYCLYEIGEYDDEKGELIKKEIISHGLANSYIKPASVVPIDLSGINVNGLQKMEVK